MWEDENSMKIHESVFVAPGAVVLGNVTVEENASIWYNATVRGEQGAHFHRKGN